MLKNDIETAIDTLIALKGAKPDQFANALERVMSAQSTPVNRSRHASLLAEGLLKGPFSSASLQTLLDIKSELPRASGGAVGYFPRAEAAPFPLIAHAVRSHGPASEWALALFDSCANGFLPFDRQAAQDVIWILESSDGDEARRYGLDDPAVFCSPMRSFFSQNAPWREIFSQADFSIIAWICANWIGGADAESEKMGAETLLRLIPQLGPAPEPAPWLACFALRHAANAALVDPLFQTLSAQGYIPGPSGDPGAERSGPLLKFCRHGFIGPAFPRAAELLALWRPEGLNELDDKRCSPLYWLNARMGEATRDSAWRDTLARAFSLLCALGADARLIAPQLSLRDLANHPSVVAALERAELADLFSPASDGERSTL